MVSKSWLLVLAGFFVGVSTAHAQQFKDSLDSDTRPGRRPADARSVETLVGPPERFVTAYDRSAIVSNTPSVIQVAQHQAGVIGLPMEVMRAKAPIVPASLPSGQRPALYGHVGPTLGAWFWQLVPGIGVSWEGESQIGTVPPMPAVPSQSIAIPELPQVSISIDKDNSGRICIKAVGADNLPLFDACADSIVMNSTDFGRLVLNGSVEINSHKRNEPARILGVAAIINLNGGTFELLSRAGGGR